MRLRICAAYSFFFILAFVIYSGQQITLQGKRVFSDDIKGIVCKILNPNFDEISFKKAKHLKKEGEIGMLSKFGYSYSKKIWDLGKDVYYI